jgi:hypothetical protein
MATSPIPDRSKSDAPPTVQRWILNVLCNFGRNTIYNWVGLMRDHLQRPGGATAMQTARYTVDVMLHVGPLRSATASLASHGDPAARSQLADAALDLTSALNRLCEARDQLLKAAGAERVY